MAKRRVRLIFRPITRLIFYLVLFFSLVAFIYTLFFPNNLANLIDNREIDRLIEGPVPLFFDDWITFLFTSAVFVFLFLEGMNLLLIKHTGSILPESVIKELTEKPLKDMNTMVMIPALNEEDTIKEAIDIGKTVGKVLVINDGSTDKTLAIAKENADYVISHSRNHGLAKAISNGIDFSLKKKARRIIIFDADLQYTQKDLENVIKVLQYSKYDIVMGSRLQGTIEEMKLKKRFGNWIFSKALTYITGIPISDGQTGLRAFSNTFASNVKFRGQFTYTQEMLFETAKGDFALAEIPIDFKIRKAGESRLMAGAIDYAIRAWSLNLQILAEYNPFRFTIIMTSILLSTSLLVVTKTFDNKTFFFLILLATYVILFTLGIFISILINKLEKLEEGINYEIEKEIEKLPPIKQS